MALHLGHPEWLIRRWLRRYGAGATRRLCEWNNRVHPLTLRVNTLKTTAIELCEVLRDEGFQAETDSRLPNCCLVDGARGLFDGGAYNAGLFHVQGRSSQVAATMAAPAPGHLVLDACAGRGGKSFLMAQQCSCRARIVSTDRVSAVRGVLIREARRLGIPCIRPVTADALDLPEALRGPYDSILLDAPCSGLGTIHRHQEIKWNRSREAVGRLHDEQTKLLTKCVEYLKVGGALLYAVCTFEPEETVDVVNAVLARGLAVQPLPAELREYGLQVDEDGTMTILPQRDDMEGFFMARLVRVR